MYIKLRFFFHLNKKNYNNLVYINIVYRYEMGELKLLDKKVCHSLLPICIRNSILFILQLLSTTRIT